MKGLLLPEVVAKISGSQLAHFFETPLDQDILQHEKTLKRQQPFSLLLPANELFQEITTPDDILIHGIVAVLYETKVNGSQNLRSKRRMMSINAWTDAGLSFEKS